MARLKTLAPQLEQLALDPLQAVNCYLIGDGVGDAGVLIDAGGKLDARKILNALHGRELSAHALTHVHPDHQGSSHRVCSELDLPFWVAERESAGAEAGNCLPLMPAGSIQSTISNKIFSGPGHPVARKLRAGDEVGGFAVVDLPGHSPGQIGYWRESDRSLICGDALRNMSFATGRPGLRLPPSFFSVDMNEVRVSAKKIAELRPALIAFGHGRALAGEGRIASELERLLA